MEVKKSGFEERENQSIERGEDTLRSVNITNNKQNPHVASTPLELEPHWWRGEGEGN